MQGIITSLLDTDFYKFTMGQLVFLKYPKIPVRYGFKNRTQKVELARHVGEKELRRELDWARELRFSQDDIDFLRDVKIGGKKIFTNPYLTFLKEFRLPAYELGCDGKNYTLEFPGPWSEAILWETIALSIINELYYRSIVGFGKFQANLGKVTGLARFHVKMSRLKEVPHVRFSDFGTRRRFSREWQDTIVGMCEKTAPRQFIGTSNVALAKKHGLVLIGTLAHEMFMVMSGIMHDNDETILRSHNQVLADWWDLYKDTLSIALTDTYGSDFFFRDMAQEQAQTWKGLRQDSGCPFEFGEKAIAFYERMRIDPSHKTLVFSDGLNVENLIKLHKRFSPRIQVVFGWGTNLTNDLGFEPLSLVVKAVEANGHGTVKLSDNLAKATGKPEDIERFKKIFSHTVTRNEMCTY